MASFRRHRGRWTATVRVPEDFPGKVAAASIAETFDKKGDARTWARAIESALKLGTWVDPRLAPRKVTGRWEDRPFREALDEYREKVTPTKKSAASEATLIRRLAGQPFAEKAVAELKAGDLAEYRDVRLAAGRAATTIRNELFTVSGVFEWLIHERGVAVSNPVTSLASWSRGLPSPAPGRERRLREGEEAALLAAFATLGRRDAVQMVALFRVLVDTGMRLGEALSLEAGWLRAEPHFIVVPSEHSKTSAPRHVALSDAAWTALTSLAEGEPDDAPVFRLDRAQVEYRWKRAREVAKITNLTLHDLRHEALSRMAARGADLRTLMRQSGHTTVQVLMRYLNPTPEEQRRRLFGAPSDAEDTATGRS